MSIRAPGVDSFPAPSASATDTATVMNPTCKSRSVWCGQEQSPLFGKIPPEIRNSIFSLALHEYDDPEQTYARDTYYTRPGFKARKKLDTSLLRTCQRIWEETQNVIWQNLEVTFFFGHSDRKPPGWCLFIEMPREANLPSQNTSLNTTQRMAHESMSAAESIYSSDTGASLQLSGPRLSTYASCPTQ